MRKFIIDTDTGSDDAAALLMALAEPDIEIIGITVLSGNIPLEQAVKNALQTVEEAGREVPVYAGAAEPLLREPVNAENVHGKDGMGDRGLIHPSRTPSDRHAVDFILETVAAHPGEIELVTLGPATNIALALMREPETMKKVKHIWSMGTGGYGPGNVTPFAEFNVFCDAESYGMLLESGIPLTVIGFDLCLGPAAFYGEDMASLPESRTGVFLKAANSTRFQHNLALTGTGYIDLPDAVAMAAALYPEVILRQEQKYCRCCTEGERYGQVTLHEPWEPCPALNRIPGPNAAVIRTIDAALFKRLMIRALGK